MDVRKSSVSDPAKWDIPTEQAPQTTWRPDLMKRLTYTQFWQLVKERQIEKVWIRLPLFEELALGNSRIGTAPSACAAGLRRSMLHAFCNSFIGLMAL